MKQDNEIGAEEMLEWAKANGMNLSYGQAADLTKDGTEDVDWNKWFEENNISPISEYDKLRDKMIDKIQKIIASLQEDKKVEIKAESTDRDEDDSIDEKVGKEKLDVDKEKEVKKRKRDVGEDKQDQEIEGENQDTKEEKDDKAKSREEEIPNKEEYLSMVKLLYKMKEVEYKEQLKKDDFKMDQYFVDMMYLQRRITKQREAFVKEYGDEELVALENKQLREEQKYKKTLDLRMEKDLSKLRELNEKLDSILDRMETLKTGLKKGTIDIEEYNKQIDSLERDKLDTLWEVNRLNPTMLEKKQETIEKRKDLETQMVPRSIAKERAVDPELRSKQEGLEHIEEGQEGVAKETHDDMKVNIEEDIDEKEKRLDELRRELRGIDIETPEGKKAALEVIGEIQTLESQKASQEKQIENMEKNMSSYSANYGDLESPEIDRRDDTEKISDTIEEIDPDTASTGLMAELKNAAMEDPSTPEQAQEYINNMQEVTEDVEKQTQEVPEPEKTEESDIKVREFRPKNTPWGRKE